MSTKKPDPATLRDAVLQAAYAFQRADRVYDAYVVAVDSGEREADGELDMGLATVRDNTQTALFTALDEYEPYADPRWLKD